MSVGNDASEATRLLAIPSILLRVCGAWEISRALFLPPHGDILMPVILVFGFFVLFILVTCGDNLGGDE